MKCFWKRILALGLACMLFVAATASAWAAREELWFFFPDVPEGKWYSDAVNELTLRGVVQGMEDGLFHPGAQVTRAAFLKMLAESSQQSLYHGGEDVRFSDVPVDAWYSDYVNWGVKNKIVSGVGNGLFSPNSPVSRQQAAVMLYRYSRNVMGKVLSTGGKTSFRDSSFISAWATHEVRAISGAGIVNGYENKTFLPRKNATRAEAAKMIYDFQKAQSGYQDTCALSDLRYIMHGGGGLPSHSATNSKQALDTSYANRNKTIEVDISWTSDNEMVLLHNWGATTMERCNLSTFLSTKLYGQYITMSMDTLADWIRSHSDVWVILDIKERNVEGLTRIAKEYPDIVERLVPYVFHTSEYSAVSRLGYPTSLLAVYQMSAIELSSPSYLVDFVREKNMLGIVCSAGFAGEMYAETVSRGVPLLLFTVNSAALMDSQARQGADGFFTDSQKVTASYFEGY